MFLGLEGFRRAAPLFRRLSLKGGVMERVTNEQAILKPKVL